MRKRNKTPHVAALASATAVLAKTPVLATASRDAELALLEGAAWAQARRGDEPTQIEGHDFYPIAATDPVVTPDGTVAVLRFGIVRDGEAVSWAVHNDATPAAARPLYHRLPLQAALALCAVAPGNVEAFARHALTALLAGAARTR